MGVKKRRKDSIRVKLISIPLIVVFIAIAAIAAISSYFTRESLLDEMKVNGINTSKELYN